MLEKIGEFIAIILGIFAVIYLSILIFLLLYYFIKNIIIGACIFFVLVFIFGYINRYKEYKKNKK